MTKKNKSSTNIKIEDQKINNIYLRPKILFQEKLKDDNYEYIPEKNKDINQITNDLKKQKFLELNSHLGL